MTTSITRLPHRIKGRSAGASFAGLAWTAAVADARGAAIEAQALDVFAKIERQLEGLGSDKGRILSATIHLADMSDKDAFDAAWVAWMGDDPEHWAPRTCTIAGLVAGFLVEIAVVAAVA